MKQISNSDIRKILNKIKNKVKKSLRHIGMQCTIQRITISHWYDMGTYNLTIEYKSETKVSDNIKDMITSEFNKVINGVLKHHTCRIYTEKYPTGTQAISLNIEEGE